MKNLLNVLFIMFSFPLFSQKIVYMGVSNNWFNPKGSTDINIFTGLNIGFEFALSKKLTNKINFNYYAQSETLKYGNRYKNRAFVLEYAYHSYIFSDTAKGFYFGNGIFYHNSKEGGSLEQYFNQLGFSFNFGYQFSLFHNFSTNIELNYGERFVLWHNLTNAFKPKSVDFAQFIFNLQLGYKF